MNNKRNVIVMFLFVMLSFAIISEVSAVSDAEADGTGLDLPIKSVDMTNHDIAGESNNKFMQNHDNDYMDDLKSHNEQNSFNNSPQLGDKDIENKNFYEHENGMFKPDDNGTLDLNKSMGMFKPDDNRPFDSNMSMGMFKPDDNGTLDLNKSMDMFKPMGDRPLNDTSVDLRNNNGTAVPKGEAVKNVAPDLKDAKNMTGPKPADNVSKQIGSNKAPVMAKNIKNNKNTPADKKPKAKAAKNVKSKTVKKVKSVKKTNNTKAKAVKKVNKKSKTAKQVKNNKPVKKVNNSKSKAVKKSNMPNKKSTKERAKL